MVGVIGGIAHRVGIGDVDLHERRCCALIAQNFPHRRYQVAPAAIGGRAVDRRQRLDVAVGEALERLEGGPGKARTGGVAVRKAKEVADGAAKSDAKDNVAVEGDGAGGSLDRSLVAVRHEADGVQCTVLPREIIGLLAAAEAYSEAGVAGSHVHKHGFDCSARYVLEGGRIHEQLPVVLVGGKVKRHLVGPAVGGKPGRRQQKSKGQRGTAERSR